MDMKVATPVPVPDFNFDSTCSSPYMTAPSSPQRLGSCSFILSAPTSPTRASSFEVPFEWKEKPSIPKRKVLNNNDDVDDGCEDFEFEFSGQLDRTSLSAEELFDCGKIRPLKPPPGFSQFSTSSPKSPRSFRNKDIDPFEAAIEKSRKNIQPRGRERTSSSPSSSSKHNNVHKKSRSLSPFRVTNITMFEQDETIGSNTSNPKSYVSSILSAISFSKGNKKWKLKDLLLFRSASEGSRATSDDSFKKYAVVSKKEAEDVRNSSFRSTESVGSTSSRRRGPVSAHEMHYTANRAVSEEMRRKTFLPYKQGLLGCLGFNPGINEVSRGIVSLTRG